MKQLLALLLVLLVVAPACRKKTTKKPAVTESVVVKKDVSREPKAKKESIFIDEPVDKFSLQEESSPAAITVKEEAANQFSPAAIKNKQETVSLFEAEEEADHEIEMKRSAEQRKHVLKTIYFDFDKFAIRKDQVEQLERNLGIIKALANEGRTIVIEGHACRFAGSDAYNLILSEKRARSITDWLVKHGIKRKNIKTVGRGYELCIVPEGTKEEQAPNRRVEFYVIN